MFAGTCGANDSIGLGSLVERATRVAAMVAPPKASTPVSALYKIAPIAQMSVRWSTPAAPSACSGDMYSGVPMSTPTPVLPSLPPCENFEMPKSMSLTSSRPGDGSCRKMFSGLRSRWTMPTMCAASRPVSAWRMMIAARPGSTRPYSWISSPNDLPLSISRTMYGPSTLAPKS